jgi:hypothetical protein
MADGDRCMRDELEDRLTRNFTWVDAERAMDITTMVMIWIAELPLEGYLAENYERGEYSRRNIEAMLEDVDDLA